MSKRRAKKICKGCLKERPYDDDAGSYCRWCKGKMARVASLRLMADQMLKIPNMVSTGSEIVDKAILGVLGTKQTINLKGRLINEHKDEDDVG